MTMTAPGFVAVDPLNPTLYNLLEHKFGEIKIANEGVSADVQELPDPFHPGRTITHSNGWGEYYRINCPFCNDVGHKLWINHLYGADYTNGRRTNLHRAICYKNNCLSAPGRREQLEMMVFGPGRPLMRKMPIKVATQEFVQLAVSPPGDIIPVDTLYEGHPALEYLRQRNFDPAALAQDFGIGFCAKATQERVRIASGRLYIPISFHGKLVGWQARAVGDTNKNLKYFNCPGTSKSRMLYNYDRASREPFVIVVEGVPSVWRLGAAAICLFGKTMSLWQRTTISTTWSGKPVFMMLDNDARGEMEQAVQLLQQAHVKVIPIYLPDKRDPADYSREEIISLISMTGAAAGLAPF